MAIIISIRERDPSTTVEKTKLMWELDKINTVACN